MLVSLHIENVATIKTVDIEFDRGFTVLSGETGAGKSIIIDSVNLLLGEKANRDLIRSGEAAASVEALFCDLDGEKIKTVTGCGIPCDGELLVYREISENGRNLIKCNGKTVPTYVLKTLTKNLISIHGQNSAQDLLDPETHIAYLDAYCENRPLLNEYGESFDRLNALIAKQRSLLIDEKEKARKTEELTRQIKEIESARLKDGEEEELIASRERIKNIEQTAKYVKTVYKSLYQNEKSSSASDKIAVAVNALEALNQSEQSVKLEESINKLTSFRYEIEEIAESVKRLISDVGEDPAAALDAIEERLGLIKQLKRKYGADINEIKEYSAKMKEELEKIKAADDEYNATKAEIKKEKATAVALADKLSQSREKGAAELTKAVLSELYYLDLKKVRFETSVTRRTQLNSKGADDVSFLLAANTGDELKPLDKTASGGELSRIMLALKSVFAGKDDIDTVIYDEVDTGISGATSERIGQRLRYTANGCQVIAITHSAQVAAQADNHILVYKKDVDGRTQTFCRTLDEKERVDELSRIIGGVRITKKVTDTAEEMLKKKNKPDN